MRDGEIGEPLVLGDAVADVKAGSEAPDRVLLHYSASQPAI
jgi:hypothetical protein